MVRRESPRTRRLRTDRNALEKLRSESTILEFTPFGDPAEAYLVRFHGKGVWRPGGSNRPPFAIRTRSALNWAHLTRG